MVETSRRSIAGRRLRRTLIVALPRVEPLVIDDVQEALLRFASLSVRAHREGDPELARWIDQAGLRAAAARLRVRSEAHR